MNQTPTAATQETLAAPISIKLNDTNYGLWSQVVEMYISGKDKLGYINGDLPQPQEIDPRFRKRNGEELANQPHGSKTNQQLHSISNGKSGLRSTKPMKCESDIEKYNSVLQEDGVYTFLDGLDDQLDKIQVDVLQLKPFPTVEQAYAHVHREDLRQSVRLTKDIIVHGAVMISKGQKSQQQPSLQLASNGKLNLSTKPKSQGKEVGCTHCRNPKHTMDTCFKLHGYLEWWHDLKAKKKRDIDQAALMNTGDTSAAAYTEPQLSLISQQGVLPATANKTKALDNPAYVHIHKTQRIKLDPYVVRCIFLGYGNHNKGYRCYDPSIRCLYTTMDVTFLESEMFFSESNYHSSLQGETVCEDQKVREGWPSFDSTTPEQCEEVTIETNKGAQLLVAITGSTQDSIRSNRR
ncbi:hypothetical protein RJ640_021990 [Escallonia rubra]|uniref:Retrotransposon Copia-like N-terminal domain-containing protein n=1 Tax=Escallonia rubra TaxID=112253 RepID=A0AA88U5D5_9ASTE|nr:hypothetical protein RJ640_021990 [Escallonia rubra]